MIMCAFEVKHRYMVQFLMSLGVALILMFIILSLYKSLIDKPVMVNLDEPFKIIGCKTNPKGLCQIKPGEVVRYRIHYLKRLDIPGDITKQLIIVSKETGETIYIPLSDTSGHLPLGETVADAFAYIPLWTPEGIGYIKLSSSYNLGWMVSHNVATTEKFEVVK
jgi:hypothetical protein